MHLFGDRYQSRETMTPTSHVQIKREAPLTIATVDCVVAQDLCTTRLSTMKLIILFAAVLASLTQASTDTSAHHRVTRQTGECSASEKKESLTECCGRLFKYSYYGGLYVTYTYTLSQQEISGQCCRQDFIYTGAPSESLSQAQLDTNYPGKVVPVMRGWAPPNKGNVL